MPIGPKGPPTKPGPSLRGQAIFSTFRGRPYVRPWPKPQPLKPGSAREWMARTFGCANRACKVTAALIYGEHWNATRGTPLLPRDLMIAFAYGRAFALTLDDGRKIYSMAARKDVSESLDAIGNAPGTYLFRGPKYWEGTTAPPGVAKAMFVYETNSPTFNLSTVPPIPWGKVEYDTAGLTDFPADPYAFTIPAGWTWATLQAGVDLRNAGGASLHTMSIWKNGSLDYPGAPVETKATHGNQVYSQINSLPIPVEPGDVFRLHLYSADTSSFLGPWSSYFAIQQTS